MRAVVTHVLLFVLLVMTYSINATSTTSGREKLDDSQKSNLHRVVSQMIGVNENDVGDRRWSPVFGGGRRSRRLPPRYIRHLYERYRNGHVVHGADTVRSVNAELGNCTLLCVKLLPLIRWNNSCPVAPFLSQWSKCRPETPKTAEPYFRSRI